MITESAINLINKIKKQEVSSKEVVQSSFSKIENVEDKIGAFITLCKEDALKRADELDQQIKMGKNPGKLAGIPIAIKDNIATKNIKTTCASKILANYIPNYNAFVVDAILKEGGIIVGKTNMDEFAMGSSNENSSFHLTKNPWDLKKSPGGSSGGSAAAVSSGEVLLALGSDTGGSIRQPASFCGIVGLKPTYGLISRFGLVAFASSLDQIGPMTTNVLDSALLLDVLSKYDPQDSTSSAGKRPESYLEDTEKDLGKVKIGIPKEFFEGDIQKEVFDLINNTISKLGKHKIEFIDISLPHTKYGISAYYIIAPSEASSNLARYDGVRYGVRDKEQTDLIEMYKNTRAKGFGEEVKRRIMLGTFALSAGYYDAYYLTALKVRQKIKEDFLNAFKQVDFIIGPTSPIRAFNLGERKDPLQLYLCDLLTVTTNLAGLPAISLPVGLSPSKLPIGLQIIAPHFEESKMLQLAYRIENVIKFAERPNI